MFFSILQLLFLSIRTLGRRKCLSFSWHIFSTSLYTHMYMYNGCFLVSVYSHNLIFHSFIAQMWVLNADRDLDSAILLLTFTNLGYHFGYGQPLDFRHTDPFNKPYLCLKLFKLRKNIAQNQFYSVASKWLFHTPQNLSFTTRCSIISCVCISLFHICI